MCSCCEVPVVCTLSPDGIAERVAEFQALFADTLAGVERDPHRLRLTFDVDVSGEATVRDLMAREKQCCAFLGFALSRTAAGLVVDITAPDGAGLTLDPFQALAQRAVAGGAAG